MIISTNRSQSDLLSSKGNLYASRPVVNQTTGNSTQSVGGYDRISISTDALRQVRLPKENGSNNQTGGSNTTQSLSGQSLSNADENKIAEMKRVDQEVRTHELAHIMAGGNLVRGGASYGYATGPDGKRYAVSGEVSIDFSPVQGDPKATVRKMEQVVRSALAPVQPSGQDRAVAASALKAENKASQEITEQQAEPTKSPGSNTTRNSSTYKQVNSTSKINLRA